MNKGDAELKNMVKKNQIMITALAIMIAVAGYLNFAGETITDEEIMTTGSDNTISSIQEEIYADDVDVATLFEISDAAFKHVHEILSRHVLVESVSDSLCVAHFSEYSAVRRSDTLDSHH